MGIFDKLRKAFTPQVVANQMLFKACKAGDVKAVEKALDLGADVNATKKVGEYSDGVGGRNNPSWEGTIEVTPLIYAAKNSFEKEDEKPYKDVIKLLAERGQILQRLFPVKRNTGKMMIGKLVAFHRIKKSLMLIHWKRF